MESNISSRMTQVAFFLLLDFDLHIQIQNIWHFIILANNPQMVRDRANITISWNHVIFNVWETVRASGKCSSTTFIEVDISHRIAPLRMLYIVTLTYMFMVTCLEIICLISRKRWQLAKTAQVRLLERYLPLNGTTANVVNRDRRIRSRSCILKSDSLENGES